MVAEFISSVLIPCGSSLIQGGLPSICQRCILSSNQEPVNQRTLIIPFLEITTSPILNEQYGKNELEQLVKLHEERKQAIIAVTGPIGIGKTVLLERFYNEFKRRGWRHFFGVVIFVRDTRKPDCSVDDWKRQVQNQIAKRLCITPWDENGSNYNDRAADITAKMQSLDFVVIIDNVIPGARLQDLGIPIPNAFGGAELNKGFCFPKRKVVFSAWTTSSLDSGWRTSNAIELSQMDEEASWMFFRCIYETMHENVKRIAKQALQLCNGLPEPIIRLAQHMAKAGQNRKRWQDYLERCKTSPNILKSPIDNLDHRLNIILSDHIPTIDYDDKNIFRSCFLFCSLFPLDHAVSKADLIDYWMCEGLLVSSEMPMSRKDHIDAAKDIIEDLLKFQLLRSADEYEESKVEIVYVYHRAALKIAQQDVGEKTHVSFGAASSITAKSKFNHWQQARRASFMHSDIEKLDKVSPDCPHLKTLIICCNSKLCSISEDFFSRMPNLRILDLSHTAIKEIPPGIYALVSLRSLNLSFTDITRLPTEIIKLKNLENLYLEKTEKLQELPQEVLSHLSGTLQVLKMNNSYNNWTSTSDQDDQTGKAIYILKLEEFRQLEYLAITVNSAALKVLLGSAILTSFTNHLQLKDYNENSLDVTSVLVQAPQLKDLCVTSSTDVTELVIQEDNLSTMPDLDSISLLELNQMQVNWSVNTCSSEKLRLSSLTITGCNALKDVSWVLYICNLKYLSISNCLKLEKLVTETLPKDAFSYLRKMALKTLPELGLICNENDTISFSSLESLCVKGCGKLVKLPLMEKRPDNLKLIQGEQSWWDQLQWGRTIAKRLQYSPIFRANN